MFSTTGKYKRLDANFYLRDTQDIDPAIERARKAAKDSQDRLERLLAEKAAGEEFHGKMIASGEVIPIK